MKTLKHLIVLLLCIAIGSESYGQIKQWGVMNPQTYSPEYKNPANGDFPIVTWGVTDLASKVPGWWDTVHACGFNMGIVMYNSVEEAEKALEGVAGSGVRLLLWLPQLQTGNGSAEVVRRLRTNPGLAGYLVADEPKYAAFPALRKSRDIIYANDTTHFIYINLYPWTPESVCGAPYPDYMKGFVKDVDLSLFSYDNYPVVMSGSQKRVNKDFYKNLELALKVSRETGKPFWAYGRESGKDNRPEPTLGDLMFEVMAALGYGAQGIVYYTYTNGHASEDNMALAPVNSKGVPSAIWGRVQTVNRQIQNLKSVFLGCTVKSVAHTGATIPEGTTRLKGMPMNFSRINGESDGLMVSHLENNGREYVVISNHNPFAKQRVWLNWDGPLNRVYETGKQRKWTGKKLALSPGGYAIFTR